MIPTRRIDNTQILATAPGIRQGRGKPLAEWRTHACPAALISADLVAFLAAVSLAFSLTAAAGQSPYFRALENLSSLGTDWHGWGSFLVLACLLGYFGTRGHYTARVPSWTVSGDVAIATVVALACDAFLTIAVYDRPLQLEGLLRWALLCPCLCWRRGLAREALARRRTVVAGYADRRQSRRSRCRDRGAAIRPGSGLPSDRHHSARYRRFAARSRVGAHDRRTRLRFRGGRRRWRRAPTMKAR